MPKVFEIDGYRGFFYSNEGSPREPVHVHVRKGEGEAKFWVTPEIRLAVSWEMRTFELSRAEELVIQHR
jgi:hypothetical protein